VQQVLDAIEGVALRPRTRDRFASDRLITIEGARDDTFNARQAGQPQLLVADGHRRDVALD
jgi:hypothetical protein